MKLIDLLVQELPKRGGWPEGIKRLNQGYDGEIEDYRDDGDSYWLPGKLKLPLTENHRFECQFVYECQADFVTRDQYEAALAASKQVAWDGAGSPPVGVTCEHCPGGTTQKEWEVVTVLGISKRPGGMFTDYWLRKEDGSSYIIGNPYRFRPIRTEAERKRDDVIKQMMSCSAVLVEATAGLIYDEIAAGKIPGIKLDGDA